MELKSRGTVVERSEELDPHCQILGWGFPGQVMGLKSREMETGMRC